MEYASSLNQFAAKHTEHSVQSTLEQIKSHVAQNLNLDLYKRYFSCIDLTSLGATDSHQHIENFTRKAVEFPLHFSDIPNVASICVYPAFVETVGLTLGSSKMAITSVSGGFPSSQTYLEVKMLETAMAVESGADEIDIVISIGEMLSGEYELMGGEIQTLKDELGDDAILKVIIESGILSEPDLIYKASIISMLAGADFVKTSTGKAAVAATPEAAVVMCSAIKDFYESTGRRVGFKAAGGISTAADAALYYTIVEQILGSEWLTPSLFRIGASSLANNLLSAIEGKDVKYF